MSNTSYFEQIAKLSAPVRIIIFIGVLAILWLPLAIPIYWLLQEDSNLVSILSMAVLFVELLFLWQLWGRLVHGETEIYARYGLVRSSKNLQEFFRGLALGFWLCLGLFIVEALLGWLKVIVPSVSLLRIVIEGLLSALGIAVAEELLFRGWLVDELRRDYSKTNCIYLSAGIFALAHFLKPLEEVVRTAVTFPALVLVGVALVLAKYQNSDRLGMSIGIHAGLVWGYYIVNVGQLIEYSDRVPVWVTGIDGNPIAGVMGSIFLAGSIGIIASADKRR